MNNQATSSDSSNATAVSVILIDLLSILLAFWAIPSMRNYFRQTTAINAAVLGGVFVLFCFGVFFIKKLESTRNQESMDQWLTQRNLTIAGVLFGIVLAGAFAHQLDYFSLLLEVDDRVLGAGESSAFFVYAPGAWLGAGLIYTLVLSSQKPPRFQANTAVYQRMAVLGLLAVNVMALFMAAELVSLFHHQTMLSGLLALILLLPLLFLPPRLIYLTKRNSQASLLTFIVYLITLVTVSVWTLM